MTPLQQLQTRVVEKPWGRTRIESRFGVGPSRQVGEIWFEPPEDHPLDVMAKYLFTSERLSIQVHPDDATARQRGYPRGKDECWIILSTEPGAELGIGTLKAIDASALIEAAEDGSIESMIDWRPAKPFQFIYNPAGTVHALGPGLTVLEIQQAVDLTYRLYDYGRPRELHLAESRDVVEPRPHHHPADRLIDPTHTQILIEGPHFGVAWCAGSAPPLPSARDIQLLPIDAPAEVAGVEIKPGECALVDNPSAIRSNGAYVLAWSVPG